jgi:hypothetical protein
MSENNNNVCVCDYKKYCYVHGPDDRLRIELISYAMNDLYDYGRRVSQRIKTLNRGVVTDEGASLIESEFIKSFLAQKEWEPDEYNSVKHVFITCDPNTSNSAKSSEMALIATIQWHGMRVVRFYYFILKSYHYH